MDFVEGEILHFDKPYGWSSFKLVGRVRWALCQYLGQKKLKVGHAGTLDPLATGVLVLCTGKATKQIESLQATTKEYVADIRLGETTPSFDAEHPVDARYDTSHLSENLVREALQRFEGELMQTPPSFSAVKVNGKRAYEHARKGNDVAIEAKPVTIECIELLGCQLPDIKIRVVCSKGTYIRALARDLGQALQCGAYLTALRRTRSGSVRVESCLSFEQFQEWLAALKPVQTNSTKE